MSLKSLKQALLIRAKGFCEYCKSPAIISSQSFVVEHIIPKSKGGKTIDQNFCNLHIQHSSSGT